MRLTIPSLSSGSLTAEIYNIQVRVTEACLLPVCH